MTLGGSVLWETNPSSMAVSQFKYNSKQLCWGEFSLAQRLWYWLFNQAALVQILSEPYIFAMHLFISFFVKDSVSKKIYSHLIKVLKTYKSFCSILVYPTERCKCISMKWGTGIW